MWPWSKKEKFLKPGTCECSHKRSSHQDGLHKCSAAIRLEDGRTHSCACMIYIPKPDEGGASTVTPTPAELEKLYKL